MAPIINAICGDAIEEMRKINDKSIRLVTADPPYNLNKNYGFTQDNMKFNEYLDFSRAWLNEAKRILTDDGSIYIFMGMRFISYIYIILEQDLKHGCPLCYYDDDHRFVIRYPDGTVEYHDEPCLPDPKHCVPIKKRNHA